MLETRIVIWTGLDTDPSRMAKCPTSTGAISAILNEMEKVGIPPGV